MKRQGKPTAPRIPSAIADTAASWVARLGGGLSPAEEADFRAWRIADPRHEAAYRKLESAWQTVTFPARSGQGRVIYQQLQRRERQRAGRRRMAGAMALGIVAVLLFTTMFRRGSDDLGVTMVARPHLQYLADGSTVELNSEAEIQVIFSETKRNVRLVRGEALFLVAKDVARPFVVNAEHVAVRAVGTAFSVRVDPHRVGVVVTEGTVAVGSRTDQTSVSELQALSPDTSAVLVSAGSRVEIGRDSVEPAVPQTISESELEAALAWRTRRIEFTRTSLAEAVALFNRQNHLQLILTDPAVGEQRVSGIFWSDDPEGFSRLLESGFGVRASRFGDEIFLRKR